MKDKIKSALRKFKPQSVRYDGIKLPARNMRYCGVDFQDDEVFLRSAQSEASRLNEHFGIRESNTILDIGCGVGRLAIGLYSSGYTLQEYHGVDISKASINWCNKNIAREYPDFQFTHLDVKNERYNPLGEELSSDFRFPFSDFEFNIIYLYSVFSHMMIEDIELYLSEFRRILKPDGKVFFTGFIEEGVPKISVNPPNYRREWKGHLHCVRYDRVYIENVLATYGFVIEEFEYEVDTDGQSGVYFSRRESDVTKRPTLA